MFHAPNIRVMFPKINIRNVEKCLELQQVKTFASLAKMRAKILARADKSKTYWKKLDRKLKRAQDVLVCDLHESDEAAKYSNYAIDAAIVIAVGGAKL